MSRKPKPVEEDELADAVLHMIIDRFGDRQLDWETVERALKVVNFKVKQAAMFAPPKEGP
jgi:hypothetical protein